MEVLKLSAKNKAKTINRAVEILRAGGTIVYPTETAYGLGADFLNSKAVRKIYKIKGRNFNKPLSVIVSSLAMAGKIIKFDNVSLKLAKKYWPGPLTLILPSKKSAKKFIGLRISSQKIASQIVTKFKSPLTATSANLAGRKESYSISEIIKQFQHQKFQPDFIINAGRLAKNKVSTMVKIERGEIEVLRKGQVKILSSKY
jgi:L-threonylcarbamoyladenylate synthase